ncbi:MAG: S-methyl-5'-thioadenosine phosphorylase [Verrucomicrobia bacterium]|nr:S-methyl-5'-thioadenosine phosphorylase [Verrucomicrobiota bacterium]MCF7707396.1 S-methyl-5'-thioadenosine phosphorylase [Verrucomicrobiota bacterium]
MSEHKIGIIGGSGHYDIQGLTGQEWVEVDTPFGKPSDSLLTGNLEGRDVVFLPRHGRGHRIMPSELNHRANIYAMKKLGVRWIIALSAVGSLREDRHPCDIVVPDQLFDRTKDSAGHSFFGDGIVAHIGFADPFCPELRKLLYDACAATGARVHDGGTYVNIEGPAFGTRAESFAYRQLGFDVVGMTNLKEAKCAREAEIALATLATVTDYDCWKTDSSVSVEEVVGNLNRNAAQTKSVLKQVIPTMPSMPGCSCHSALENSILTKREFWPEETKIKLNLILERFI